MRAENRGMRWETECGLVFEIPFSKNEKRKKNNIAIIFHTNKCLCESNFYGDGENYDRTEKYLVLVLGKTGGGAEPQTV